MIPKPIRRSLALKLTLVIVFVGLIGVVVVALFAQQVTRREISILLVSQARDSFISEVTDYYSKNRTWDGLLNELPRPPGPNEPKPNQQPFNPPQPNQQRSNPPQPKLQPSNSPSIPLPANAPRADFLLLTTDGCVITPLPPYRPNECLDTEEYADGFPVMVGEEQVGIVLVRNEQSQLFGLEGAFIRAINVALRNATIAATIIALLLGFLFARYLTQPLKELTTALRAMTDGELEQEVAIRSEDELGVLAAVFNQMSTDLTTAHRLRRQMTADIAHDLRNPLSILSGYIESMRDGVLEPTAERLEIMHSEAKHLQHLVDDLWTLARADAGELQLNCQKISPIELLNRAAASYAEQAEAKQIQLTIDCDPTLASVEVDAERMAQVLGNLVSNALRYTSEQGAIRLLAHATGEGIEIAVCDNGAGIDSATLPFVFERFYRADDARVHSSGESGLGLAIVKMIVSAHGGEITAESEPNVETVFRIQLPLAAA